jgi:N-acetyl sugar amidotransferase
VVKKYQICTKCILDTTAPYVEFDENGVCNYCRREGEIVKRCLSVTDKEKKQKLSGIVAKIKKEGKNKKYDCVLGLSGGVDSSYLAWLAKKLGLRPLVVNLNNGWDPEITVNNVRNIVKKLGLDLYTYKINCEEFKDLQLAYFKASVIDIEALTDHAIKALLYNTANQRNIKYILVGSNYATEGVLPKGWAAHDKNDLVNLKAIHNQFSTVKLKTFPTLGFWKKRYYERIKKIKSVALLNLVPYVRKDVKKFLIQELGWRDYGAKHFESIFTRFYQSYILPKKFNIDKRRAHLSSLIYSDQITREEALEEMKHPPYPSEEMMKKDKEYVLKKLGLTNEEFEKIMALPIKSHLDYKSNVKMAKFITGIFKILRSLGSIYKFRKNKNDY